MFGANERNKLEAVQGAMERLKQKNSAYSTLFVKMADAMWINHVLALKSNPQIERLAEISNIDDSEAFDQLDRSFSDFCENYQKTVKEAAYRGHDLEFKDAKLGELTEQVEASNRNVRELTVTLKKTQDEVAHWRSISESRRATFTLGELENLGDEVIIDEIARRFALNQPHESQSAKSDVMELVLEIIDRFRQVHPDRFVQLKALAYVSEDRKRIEQYETILNEYNIKIARLRAQNMDDEDKEEAIQAMKRLRDREIELLANAEVANG